MDAADPKLLADTVISVAAGRRIRLFIDFDGTLTDFTSDPESVRLPVTAAEALRGLISHSQAVPVIVTGRSRGSLRSAIGELNIDMAAEHGRTFRSNDSLNWKFIVSPEAAKDLVQILPLFERFAAKVPGSFVEKKEFSLTWHYRMADEIGENRLGELKQEVEKIITPQLRVVQGKKVLEITSASGGKGDFINWYCKAEKISCDRELIIAAGDDSTDEDMFSATNHLDGISVKVGPGETSAKFRLTGPGAVISFIQELAAHLCESKPG